MANVELVPAGSTIYQAPLVEISVHLNEYDIEAKVKCTNLNKSSHNFNEVEYEPHLAYTEKSTAFETFAQIVAGSAEFEIGGSMYYLSTGQSIVLPAHTINIVKPFGPCKIIFSAIKDLH